MNIQFLVQFCAGKLSIFSACLADWTARHPSRGLWGLNITDTHKKRTVQCVKKFTWLQCCGGEGLISPSLHDYRSNIFKQRNSQLQRLLPTDKFLRCQKWRVYVQGIPSKRREADSTWNMNVTSPNYLPKSAIEATSQWYYLFNGWFRPEILWNWSFCRIMSGSNKTWM